MGLPNIHNIRYSFTQLRLLLNSNVDQNTYLQTLQSTLWLQNIICLFNSVDKCLNALCFEGNAYGNFIRFLSIINYGRQLIHF